MMKVSQALPSLIMIPTTFAHWAITSELAGKPPQEVRCKCCWSSDTISGLWSMSEKALYQCFPVLVLGTQCPACFWVFHCSNTPEFLLNLVGDPSTETKCAGIEKHLKHAGQWVPQTRIEKHFFLLLNEKGQHLTCLGMFD